MKFNLSTLRKRGLISILLGIVLIAGGCSTSTFDQKLRAQQEETYMSWMHEAKNEAKSSSIDVDADRMMETVLQLVSCNRDTATGKERYRAYLDSAATAMPGTLSWHDFYMIRPKGDSVAGKNWIYKTGEGNRPIWMITAHYDVVENSPGADDNASGVAAMLEIASQLQSVSLDKEVWFVAFDLEEPGLHGSYHFLKSLDLETLARIDAVINLDMIGYINEADSSQNVPEGFELIFPDLVKSIQSTSSKADFAIAAGNFASRNIMADMVQDLDQAAPELRVGFMLLPNAGKDVQPLRESDHAHFWDAKLPTVYIGDGADTRNAHYHTANDEPTDVNAAHMANVTKWLTQVVAGEGNNQLADN